MTDNDLTSVLIIMRISNQFRPITVLLFFNKVHKPKLAVSWLQRKVDRYWPEALRSPIRFGNVIVELTNQRTVMGYDVKDLIVSMVRYFTLHRIIS
jgi:hypothetical protein